MAEKRIPLYAVVDGEHCSSKCPLLIGTTEGVPDHVRKAYPEERVHVCLIYGQLDHVEDKGSAWAVERPKRAPGCMALEDDE